MAQPTRWPEGTLAFSYLRFSTSEQRDGNSLHRQRALADNYAEAHGLRIDRTLTYHDLGVSGFHGVNAQSGRLADFLNAISLKLVPAGSVLLVEHLDRLSRDYALNAQSLLTQIILAGISVVTLADGRVYSEAELHRDPMGLIYALLSFIRANEESQTKSNRSRAAWVSKRHNAKREPMTGRVPGWLRLDKAGLRFELIADRVKVIRRIYALALLGLGPKAIADRLNDEHAIVWQAPEQWARDHVHRLLTQPMVTGVMRPHLYSYDEGRTRRIPLKPIKHYYPAIIAARTFDRVQGILDRRYSRGSLVRWNVFCNLAECPECGSALKWVEGMAYQSALICRNALVGRCDRFVEYDHQRLYALLIERLPSHLRDQISRGGSQKNNKIIASLYAKVDHERSLARLNPENGYGAVDDAEEALQQALLPMAHAPSDVAIIKLIDCLADIQKTPESLSFLNRGLKEVFSRVQPTASSDALSLKSKKDSSTLHLQV